MHRARSGGTRAAQARSIIQPAGEESDVGEPAETLRGESVFLRRATPADAPRLGEIIATPSVAEWWGRHDPATIVAEVIAPGDDTVVYAIEADGQVAGIVQYWEEDDPEYRHAGIDIFLDPACHGRGLGADAVRTVARHLFADRGHHRVVIDPAADNHRAIRSYQRVGFRAVGVMRRYWRDPEGRLRDGLLMDLLPDDLT